MPAYSRSEGPALQRHHEDGAALASELVAADVPERADLIRLHRALTATPFTGLALVEARHIAAKLITRDAAENARHDELLTLHRRGAGEYERRNAETFAGQEKTPRQLGTDEGPKETEHRNPSTPGAQLTLFGGAND